MEAVTCGEILNCIAQARMRILTSALVRLPDTQSSAGWGWLKTITIVSARHSEKSEAWTRNADAIILNELVTTDKPRIPKNLFKTGAWLSDYMHETGQSLDITLKDFESILRSPRISRYSELWYCNSGSYYPVTIYKIHDSYTLRLGCHFKDQPGIDSNAY